MDSDGVCDELEVEGCFDELAENYNEIATDEGPCEYSLLSSFEWTQLINNVDIPDNLNKSSFGFDRLNRRIYFVNLNANEFYVYAIDNNDFYTLNINSWPNIGSAGSFIFNPEINAIQAFNVGTDDVYQVTPIDGSPGIY